MSDTPRTDAEWQRYAREGHRDAGHHFAANLERELNDTNAVSLRYAHEIDRLKEEIEQNAWKSSPALAQGMSLRDYFAGQALVGLSANPREDYSGTTREDKAVESYRQSDAMLAAREAKP